ncbi:MAG: hypothetical protein FJ109_00615 [Deltaproteobacteria bacterium]|nr:hypothetical protein [Deltaproteobacteria bacterium]
MRARGAVGALVGLLLALAGTTGRAEEIVVRIDLGTAAAGDSAPGAVWNRIHRLPAALGAGEGYPLLLLLPPDTRGRPVVTVEPSDCHPAKPPVADDATLISLFDGRPMPLPARRAEASGHGRIPDHIAKSEAASDSPSQSESQAASQSDSSFPARPVTSRAGESPFFTSPLLHEGDALLLPLLLRLLRVQDGHWERCGRFSVRVQVDRSGAPRPDRGHFLPDRMTRLATNASDVAKWYAPAPREDGMTDYVIVTREQFASTSKMLSTFIDFKKSQGYTPLLVTLEQIDEEMEAVEPAPEEQPDILRAWLQKHYQEAGFKYLVLLGSPDPHDPLGIPMKLCYPSFGYEEILDYPHVATDMYFADLTGNWNPDGDEMPCELEDYMEIPEEFQGEGEAGGSGAEGGFDGGADRSGDRLDGVDLAPELLVGRIPHFGKQPFYGDGILERIIAYEQSEPLPWHNRVLLPSPMITFPDGGWVDGSLVSKFLIEKSLDVYGNGHTVLGEWAGNLTSTYPGDDFLDESKMPEYWNKGYGAVTWSAHGNFDLACRDIWYVDANEDGLPQQGETEEPAFINILFHKVGTDDYPPIVFQGSCLTACPEEHGNLTHSLLQHASIANVASTRITMGLTPGQDEDWVPSPFTPGAFTLGVYFTHAAAVEKRPIAEAFHYAMGTLGLGVQPWTFKVRLEFNLYGDPSLQMPGCDEDSDCDDGNPCDGIETCVLSRCRPGKPLLCKPDEQDGPCVKVECDPAKGCVSTPIDDFGPCDDGDPCTGLDYCMTGECVTAPLKCPAPDSPCYAGTCDPVAGKCLYEPLPDGDYCFLNGFSGTCLEGTCRLAPTAVESDESIDIQPEVAGPVEDVVTQPKASGGCAATGSAKGRGIVLLLAALAVLMRVSAGRRRSVAIRGDVR